MPVASRKTMASKPYVAIRKPLPSSSSIAHTRLKPMLILLSLKQQRVGIMLRVITMLNRMTAMGIY